MIPCLRYARRRPQSIFAHHAHAHNPTCMSEHPFSNRETRIKRREERNLFRRKLLPLAWAISTIGYAGLLILVAYYLLYSEWPYNWAGPFIFLAILPLVLTLVSWSRGHHSDRLEEP